MQLAESQVELIKLQLQQSGITLSTLRDDLLDHLCCDIESAISEGKQFDKALIDAIKKLAPDGLYEIQNETNLLLNAKYIPMKVSTYSIGLLSSMMMAAGNVMQILHLPGAGSPAQLGVGTVGFMLFVLIFLPMLVASKFGRSSAVSSYDKTRIVTGVICGFITLTGVTFKILHLAGANMIFLIGAVLFIFVFLPMQFFSLYKNSIAGN